MLGIEIHDFDLDGVMYFGFNFRLCNVFLFFLLLLTKII
jgi:hypothetical protein